LADITALQADLTTANEDKIRALAEVKRIEDLRESAKTALTELTTEQSQNKQKVEVIEDNSNDETIEE